MTDCQLEKKVLALMSNAEVSSPTGKKQAGPVLTCKSYCGGQPEVVQELPFPILLRVKVEDEAGLSTL